MSPTCAQCGGWIHAANHRHPGYCSPRCRDIGVAELTETREARKRHRRAMRARGTRKHNATEVAL